MTRRLWLRIGLVAFVAAVSIFYLYPPRQSINLGLDLQGGIHLVLGVDIDKALQIQTDRTAERVRASLEAKGIAVQKAERRGNTEIQVQLASPTTWAEAQTLLQRDFPFFEVKDADQGAGRLVLAMRPKEIASQRESFVSQGLETIRNRVDQFGVAEPSIQRQGDNRILVQLPGVQDPERAKSLIGKTALLEFKLVDDRVDAAQAVSGAPLPPTAELLYERRVDPETKQERRIPIVVQKKAMLTGADVSDAEVRLDQGNQPYVSLTLTPAGGKVFAQVTTDNVGRLMAIVLDGNVYSAPRIQERIPSGQAQITGSFTIEQARDLKIVLKAGALPAPVQILEERSVGPSLGADSIRKGILSTVGAAAAVVLFMLLYYRVSGLIADVALALNLLILLAAMAGFHATLTLPGIAGVVLTIGMAVDTNILIFERIREELRSGKTVRAAIDSGFARAFRTVIDTHVTVLVSAAILYQFGTGPVKGFAVTLAIGIFASLFTAVFFTRLIFDLIYMRGRKVESISI